MSTTLFSVAQSALSPEPLAVAALLARIGDTSPHDASMAAALISHIRAHPSATSVETFLQVYGLDTSEGVALMCLAEALLRIPDAATADAFVKETIARGDWETHLAEADSLLMSVSGWGMALAGRILRWGDKPAADVAGKLRQLVARMGEEVVEKALRQAVKFLGSQFVMGETIAAAIEAAEGTRKFGFLMSYDMLGEGARSNAQSVHYTEKYLEAVRAVGSTPPPQPSPARGEGVLSSEIWHRDGISVKLSALYPRYETLKYAEVRRHLLPRLQTIVHTAMESNIPLTIDAEEAHRLDISLLLFRELLRDRKIRAFGGVGLAVQAYQKRSLAVVDYLCELSTRLNTHIPVRLVKGAYWDAEIKRGQMLGLADYPVFTRKIHTDASFLAAAKTLLSAPRIYPQFATHNAVTAAAILRLSVGRDYEFQRLLGMGETLHTHLMEHHGARSRIYAPVGPHRDLLAYLIRRLLENGANSSFVHAVADADVPIENLLRDPVETARDTGGKTNPHIPLPAHVYGEARKNSTGTELGFRAELRATQAALKPWEQDQWAASPLLAGHTSGGTTRAIISPAHTTRTVGHVVEAQTHHAHPAMQAALAAFPEWSRTPVETRAALLEKIADLYVENTAELTALLMHEAGKTIADATAEVREAIDFCRYYAAQAREHLLSAHVLPGPVGERNRMTLHGRGVFVCISPWNFPLAIFTGQIVAALVTGNTTIAKPAGQTPLIAHRAVQLMHQAGIRRDVLQCLPGDGAQIGQALISNPQIAGVVFTGSTATAKHIQRTLAQHARTIPVLIAETGGQNAMIIDSTALLEQTVDNVVASAFYSAGQRCSALRVAFVQDDIADDFLRLLSGAMQCLRVGDPWNFSTDIGPVIDAAARAKLETHITRMKNTALWSASSPSPFQGEGRGEGDITGHFITPHAFEISSITQLTEEIFGPVLHIIRYPANGLDAVIDAINNTGYGLTLGIETRLESRARYIAARARVGNIYINRAMTGAVVGVQPFGGEGLSGTGPKAGGPHYLLRFCTERTVTTNTAAVGGDVELFTRG